MPTFSLTEDTISRLRTKFTEFQKARKRVHALITRYVADYRQFNGTTDDRKEFLEEKYSRLAPSFSHLVADEKGILWNVSDIALLMGRTQQAISSTLMKLERSEGWCARLLALRQSAKSANGNKIFVYSEEIFDLLMVKKIVFSRAVQKKNSHRFMALAAIFVVFLAVQYLAMEFMKMDLSEHVAVEIIYVIISPVIVFVCRMVLRWYRSKKIHKRYGDGSGGFMFDDMLKQDALDEINRQNQQIHGDFDSDCSIKTKHGTFVGKKVKDSLFFYGIPYAKPPIGKLRWKAPEPLPESDEVFEAKYFGAPAIQADYEGSPLKHHRQSEDCLTLNICTGCKRTVQKQPVIVIFHHGDFSYGSSADPLFYADNFLKIYPDTVCVTFNYRLGILGFIDFSEVPGGDEYPDAINLGLLDQIAALQWIKENISALGGDPEKITVMASRLELSQ
ncbi:MAG: carboxylesterase family protein [Synergistaceae bacterium]|nr:carboxylesterase family protein [Synergistaceae bacterium]